MNALMIQVERIVRPIAATQARKLRMRVELLAHLQSALDEERARSCGDDQAAVEQVKRRLGDPVDLTRELQQTVPFLERHLLARVGTSFSVNALEQWLACVPGQRGKMTMGHKTVLSAIATLAVIPLLISVLRYTSLRHATLSSSDLPLTQLAITFTGAVLGWMSLVFISYRFVFSAARSDQEIPLRRLFRDALMFVALQLALTFLLSVDLVERFATVGEMAVTGLLAITLLSISIAGGRCIARLRRRYDPWLMLSFA